MELVARSVNNINMTKFKRVDKESTTKKKNSYSFEEPGWSTTMMRKWQ